MSLNYDLTKIPEDVRTVVAETNNDMRGVKAGDVVMPPVTNSLIWACLSVGMREITEKNYREFFARVHLTAAAIGDPDVVARQTVRGIWDRNPDGSPALGPITIEDVKAHIGLKTNVTDEKPAEFYKRLINWTLESKVARERPTGAAAVPAQVEG